MRTKKIKRRFGVLVLGLLPNGGERVLPFLESLDWAREAVAIFAHAGLSRP